jgi:hypothetical protein
MEGRLVQTERIDLRGKVKDMFVQKYRKTSFLMVINFMMSLGCYYGIVFVSERLFQNTSLYECEFITTLAELPAVVVAWYIDRIGRKKMMEVTWTLETIGFFIIAIFWFYD